MPANAFFRRGTTKVWFAPTVAGASPTAAEVNAGTRLVNIADMSGFSFANNPITTPDLDTVFDSQIPGVDAAEDSVITFYEPKTGTDALFTTLAKGVSGFIVIFYRGIAGASPAAADKCELWPVVSSGPRRMYGMDASAARWSVTLSPSAPPNVNATLT
jgi:hypothetical protein